MSVKTTKEITRKQAIEIIVDKKIEELKEHMKHFVEKNFTNKELEILMNKYYYESEFDNYSIYE